MKKYTIAMLVAGAMLATSCSKGPNGSGGSPTFGSLFPQIDTAILWGNSGISGVSGYTIHDRIGFFSAENGSLIQSYNSDPYTGIYQDYQFTITSVSGSVATGTLTEVANGGVPLTPPIPMTTATLGIYQSASGRSYYRLNIIGQNIATLQSTIYVDSI